MDCPKPLRINTQRRHKDSTIDTKNCLLLRAYASDGEREEREVDEAVAGGLLRRDGRPWIVDGHGR